MAEEMFLNCIELGKKYLALVIYISYIIDRSDVFQDCRIRMI